LALSRAQSPDESDVTTAERWRALVISAVVIACVASPVVPLLLRGERAPDSFPLSTYPMFTDDPGRVVEVPTVVAVHVDGRIDRLPPEVIADTDQVIQAYVAVQNAIHGEPGAAADLCTRAAARLSDPGSVVEVLVAEERYDSVRWAAGHHDPIMRRVYAECEPP
jgi:hypothetical protein